MELNEEKLIDIYSFFAKELYLNKHIIEKKSEGVALTFIDLIGKRYSLHSLGVDFFWQYSIFQFSYWSNLTIKSFDSKMKFSFIFGKKALERFLERDNDYDWQLFNNNIAQICSKKKFSELFKEDEEQSSFSSEKIYKQQFYNQENGLANCLNLTSLFDPKENLCQKCSFKEDCKELLRMNYPHLYNKRIKS